MYVGHIVPSVAQIDVWCFHYCVKDKKVEASGVEKEECALAMNTFLKCVQ